MTLLCCHCHQPLQSSEKGWYGLHQNCFIKSFGLSEISDFLDLIARSQSHITQDSLKINTSFFHGAYRKYSARLGNTSYILKVQQKEYPELPATEFLCNQIYKSLSLFVPEHYLVRFPEDALCFVTKNFMPDSLMADLIHIYRFLNEQMNYDCETLVKIIGEQTGRRAEQEKFAYLTLADSLIGNHDRHGRNLGFIKTLKGVYLAPFYDNPSALALEDPLMLGADLQPRGAIFTKDTDRPTTKDYVREWTRLGYNKVVEQFRKNYSFEKVHYLVAKSHLSEKRQKALLRLISQRSEELCDN